MPAQPDETIPLHLPADIRQRTRTLASGRVQKRFTVEVKADPMLHHFSDKELGREPAEQLAAVLRENLRSFGRRVSASTQRQRGVAAKAFDKGERWALKRYSGGRTGPKRPDPNSSQWFQDSGRLIDGLYPTWNQTDGHYTINAPANRLDRATFGPGFENFLQQFSLALNTGKASEDQRFKRAQAVAVGNAIQSKKDMVAGKRAQLTAEVARLLRLGG